MARRVLVVEDERMMRIILRDNLEYEGYQVVAVETGEEALAAAVDQPPDLILLDVMLPGISGYEVCRRIRASGSDVPIVMVSARNTESDRRSGAEAGTDAYIGKPFNVLDLLQIVGRYVQDRPTVSGPRVATDPRTPRDRA